MYEHNDQSWREQPRVMSADTQSKIAERLAEYATKEKLDQILVIFHGGEPLLAGPERLAAFADEIRTQLNSTRVDFSLQTNGTLLSDEYLDVLEAAGIGVSLSLDGPEHVNDLHRRTAQNESTFPKVVAALRRLQLRPKVFSGVISVVDPSISPADLLTFFSELELPALDLLLPDANYTRPPAGRDAQPDLYKNWLLQAFDLWFDHYPTMRIRTFDTLLGALVGVPGGTDAFGFGDISLLSIETDGSYHDLDVLKITKEGQTALGASIYTSTILDVASSAAISARRELLMPEGLAPACQACPVVDVCGGGSVPHRYSADGFQNPTVYCEEMLALIQHANKRVLATVAIERDERAIRGSYDLADLASYDRASHAADQVRSIHQEWRLSAEIGRAHV